MTQKDYYDFREDGETRQVSLEKLLRCAFRKWKLILLMGILLGCFFGAYKILSIHSKKDAMIKAYDAYKASLEMYNTNVADYNRTIQELQASITERFEYLDTAPSMQVDPYNCPLSTAQLRFVPADDSEITADDMYSVNRRLSRNPGGDPPNESALFYEPIDEGRLSDCFMKIIADYFGDGDKCKLYGHDFKLHEFCLFVHFYFRRIGIMKTNARQPFSEYVRKSVLKDGAAFTDKTFNNVAKLYEDEEKEFTDKKMHEINFDFRPSKDAKSNKPLQQLLYAFQDIGYNFHNSDYFRYLRDTRKRMNDFYL